MAEGLFRHKMQDNLDVEVASAGVGAGDGQAPSSLAVTACAEVGIEINAQRSNALTSDLVETSDFIFGMKTRVLGRNK